LLLLINQKKEKKAFNPNTQDQTNRFLAILKNTDKVKDAKSKTTESEELGQLLTIFQSDLFIPVESTAEEGGSEESATESKKKEKLIDLGDQTELTKVLRSLLRDLKPHFKNSLTETTSDLSDLTLLVGKLHNATEIIGHQELIQFFENYARGIEFAQTLSGDERESVTSELLTLYNSFSRKANPEFKYEIYRDRIDKLMAPKTDAQVDIEPEPQPELEEVQKPELKSEPDFSPEDISINDKDTLLNILLSIEEVYLIDFYTNLKNSSAEKGNEGFNSQINHFQSLFDNLDLINCAELKKFPQQFLKVFRSKEISETDDMDLRSIEDCYRDILRIISDQGTKADIKDSLSILSDTLFGEEEQQEKEPEKIEVEPEKEVTEEDLGGVVPETEIEEETEDSGEEDLDEIFKQESENYIGLIRTAIQDMKKNPKDTNPYESIEKSLHSMKSSARLMGYNDVADLSGPMEKLIEKLRATGQSLKSDELLIIERVVSGLESGISHDEIDTNSLLEELKKIDIQDTFKNEVSSTQSDASEDEVIEEQLFADSDTEDEDLLEIFKDESGEYIAIAENSIQSLSENLSDTEALGQLENAMHSMKTAAKMLGFSEIGQIADSVEVAVVSVLKGEIKNNPTIIEGFIRAINLVNDLTKGKKQDSELIENIASELNIYRLKELESSQPSSAEAEKIEMKSPDLDDQTQMFVKEGWELLEKLNRDLLNLEKNPGNPSILADLNRTIHTLKGSAQILDFKQIGTLAHKIEDLFAKSQSGISDQEVDVIFKSIDVIQDLIKSIKRGEGEQSNEISAVIDQVDAILNDADVKETDDKTSGSSIPPLSEPKLVGVENAVDLSADNEQFIKITTDNLDNLVNMAAELVINKTQLNAYLEKLRRIAETIENDKKRLRKTDRTISAFMERTKDEGEMSEEPVKIDENVMNDLLSVTDDFKDVVTTFDSVSSSFRSITRDFEQNIGQISSLSKSLHDNILQVRLVPTEMLFNRFPRAVRDMAKKLKKKVNLVVEGEQTEMDRALIESLTDPVMHLVRNAIDHGIELPAERKEQGKSADGIILLKAKRSKNQIIIEIQDDGRGIDPDLVKSEIIKKELAEADEVENMTSTEVLEYLFQSGFSTRDEASDVSGRGVGLDVVFNQLKKLKGDIRINSTPGKGTIFIVRVPLTLAIAQAIMVKVGEETLAIPISAVEETVQFQDPELVEKDERAFITVHDKLIPVAYLSSLLNFGTSDKLSKEPTKTAIIVREAGSMYALIVDGVIGREEIVIKSLGEELSKIPYISGGTVSGDGSVILILDVPSISQKIRSDVDEPEEDFSAIERARKVISQDSKEKKPKVRAKKKSPIKPGKVSVKKKRLSGRAPVALIVDDSVSVRKFVSSVLEKNKYATVLAEDGPEALEELKKEKFDIIITDLEMPKMQGFDLIEEIRKQRAYQHIPIVILTGRAGKKHKDRGVELGANAYITKPFKEGDLLNTLENFIEIA